MICSRRGANIENLHQNLDVVRLIADFGGVKPYVKCSYMNPYPDLLVQEESRGSQPTNDNAVPLCALEMLVHVCSVCFQVYYPSCNNIVTVPLYNLV